MQEVALVLAAIQGLMKLYALRAVNDPGVVAGGKVRGAQPSYVPKGDAELDLAIAEHVRIWSPACTLLVEEILEDARLVFGREAHPVQGNIELLRDGPGVLEVLCGCTVAVVVLFPVAHEEPLHRPTLFLEQQGGHGGIHSARQSDDD